MPSWKILTLCLKGIKTRVFAPFRCFFVQLSTDCSLGFYLDRLKKGLSPLRVKFAITIVNKEHHNKTIFRGKASKSLLAM